MSPRDAWQVCPYCRWRMLKLEGVYSPRFLFKGGERPAVCRHCRGRVVVVRRVKHGLRETTVTMTVRPVMKKAPAKRRRVRSRDTTGSSRS